MSLLLKSDAAAGLRVRVTPESAGWRYVGFEAWQLPAGAHQEFETGGREVCLVLLSGICDIAIAQGPSWPAIGGRSTPFDGPPAAAYIPPGSQLAIGTERGVEFALCSAPAEPGIEPALIQPRDVEVFTRGTGATEREIRNILMENRPAEALLVTEVVTPGGHWSSYPPHKHDTDDPPREAYLEETYYHRLKRPGGFAMQRVYSAERGLDVALTIADGDVVLVPFGYHPVTAAAGYDLYYLNVMAGPRRRWLVTNDPAHEWQLA